MNNYQELMDFVEEENIRFIRLAFFDVFGQQKNVAVMSGELQRVLEQGISFDASAIRGFGNAVKSDLFLKPDLSTISIVPWRPIDGRVARMFCDICYPDGRSCEKDTRFILKQAMKAAEKAGLQVNFGPEVEFYVFKLDEKGERTHIPLDHAGYMDIDPLDKGDNIRRDICFSLLEMGITPEASHHEQGPGQNEIDFRYSAALSSADNTVTFKWTVRSIAESNGCYADFSPKPLRDEAGNGMHINISLRSEDGQDHTMEFMAGILEHIRDITLFLNPTAESYERFGKLEAPSYISWGEENRSQLIRIPASGDHVRRIELRSPDPQANPYLAYALLIYAGLDGIQRGLQPPEPLDVNLYMADSDITAGLPKLPEKIEEAMSLARHSEFVRKLLPADILEAYCGRDRI